MSQSSSAASRRAFPACASGSRRRGHWTIAAALAGVLASAAEAQERAITQYQIQAWQRPQGLPGNSVTAIVQSPNGYLWISTEDGLARFDGVSFANFTKANTPALTTNDVTAIALDGQQGVWIGTSGGGLVRHDGRTAERFSTRDGLSNDAVHAMLEDEAGDLWVATADGLDRVRNGRAARVTALGKAFVRALAPASGGGVWAGTEKGGIFHVAGDSIHSPGGSGPLASESVRAILEDGRGGLWVGTVRGLFHLRGGRLRAYTTRDGLPGDEVRALMRDQSGAIWIATAGGGLSRLGDRIETLSSSDGLPGDVISVLFQDREGNIWVGTSGAGLAVLRRGTFLPLTTREGLSGDIALPILEDRDGALWIGTFGSGLNRLKDGRLTALSARDGLDDPYVLSLAEGPDSILWIGMRSGLSRRRKGAITRYRAGNVTISSAVTAILADAPDAAWVGTNAGLWRAERGRLTSYTTAQGLGNNFVYALHRDARGDLWIGTNGGGLNRLRNGVFESFTSGNGLGSDVIYTLHEDADGTLWIATSSGLTRYRNGAFRTLDVRHGLFDDKIYRILDDDAGNFWMSSNRGVFRVPRGALNAVADGRASAVTSLAYGEHDGLPSGEGNGGIQPAGWKDRRGRMWFPTMKGVASVDPARATGAGAPFPVVVERVLVNDAEVVLGGESLKLPPGTRRLELGYTALSLLAPEAIAFQYRLDGYDDGWIDAGTRRSVSYTNLEPGPYTFRVRARNQSGRWSESQAAVPLAIEPYLYQTTGFRFAAAALLLAMIAGVDRWRVSAHRMREQQLLALVDERERAESRYRELFEGANDIVFTADLAGRLTSLNRRGQEVLGVRAGQAGGVTLDQIVDPGSRQLLADRTSPSGSATPDQQAHEMLLRGADGRQVPAEASLQVIRENGHPVGIQAIARDITERRNLETRLRQSEKLEAVGRLAGGIAHDFNNLMSVIKSAANMLREDVPAASDSYTDVVEIEKAADRAAALTQQLLAYSRRQVLTAEVLDLNAVVREVESMLRRTIRENIQLSIELEPELFRIEADPGQMHQVLMNLAVNARDAMPQGGRLTIRTCNATIDEHDARGHAYDVRPGTYVCLRVQDTGMGMDARTQEQIFEPFFTTKEQGKGTGLGLATVYGIVKQSGGYIWPVSEPGRGTTFDIYLPRTDKSIVPGPVVTGAAAASTRGGETILVVEDHDALRNLFKRILERAGYVVLVAANAQDALAVADGHAGAIHLLLTDVIMPGMSGPELAKELCRRRTVPRILFTSGYTEEDISQYGVLDTGVAFMQKPASPDVLRGKVRALLDVDMLVHA